MEPARCLAGMCERLGLEYCPEMERPYTEANLSLFQVRSDVLLSTPLPTRQRENDQILVKFEANPT